MGPAGVLVQVAKEDETGEHRQADDDGSQDSQPKDHVGERPPPGPSGRPIRAHGRHYRSRRAAAPASATMDMYIGVVVSICVAVVTLEVRRWITPAHRTRGIGIVCVTLTDTHFRPGMT